MSETAYARSRRDERIADEAPTDRSLMCSANGCPHRWSVDLSGMRCCSAHAWAEPREWPSITAALQDAETERAYRAGLEAAAPPAPPAKPDPRRLAAVLSRLKVGGSDGQSPRQRVVARLLQIQRERPLTQAQRDMLQACGRGAEPSEIITEDLR